jgi:hypothetical protein
VTPEQAAHETRDPTVFLPAKFMSDSATYVRGAELGFDGTDFYFGGRGGALGDVTADVVVAAFVFFAPTTVTPAWERAGTVMPRRDAAVAWMECAATWATTNLGDEVDWARLAHLLGRIVDNASFAGVPLFAGAHSLPLPSDPRALAIHRLDLLRELRGGLHGAAVLTVGLQVNEAISVIAPQMHGFMGWEGDALDAEPLQERWRLAEARTDRMVGRHFAILTADERAELVELLKQANS